MKCLLRPLLFAGLLLALVPTSARAFEFGIGIEAGGSFTHLKNDRGEPDLGLILEQRFQLPVVALTLWEDLHGLVDFDEGWLFFPIDVGLRAELTGRVFTPYIGVLINDSISPGETTGCGACSATAVSHVPGAGGDIGFDVAVAFLRLGLELRAYETLIPPVSGDGYGNGFVLQGLLSVRAEL